jgi:hypothetical protein
MSAVQSSEVLLEQDPRDHNYQLMLHLKFNAVIFTSEPPVAGADSIETPTLEWVAYTKQFKAFLLVFKTTDSRMPECC